VKEKESREETKAEPKVDDRSARELQLVMLEKVNQGDHEQVPALANLLRKHPDVSDGDLMALGEAWFALAEMEKSVEAYDEVLKRRPTIKPHLWQRGLALYYNNEFERGVDQFNSHQTLGTSDIENSVWHLMCNAKLKPLAEARKELIPNPGETRRMMHSVYDLFAGTGSTESVLEASGYSEGVERIDSRVYHGLLYVGLYHEMKGDKKASVAAMKKAQRYVPPGQGLMSHVAMTHLKLRSDVEK